MRFDTDIDVKDRKRLVLTDFRGVDASNPVYNVDTKRASAMLNFISIDGNNHKRNGWKQYCTTFPEHLNETNKINGVFDFTIKGHTLHIVYAGRRFYIKNNSGDYVELESFVTGQTSPATPSFYSVGNLYNQTLKDRKCTMYLQDDKAYFFGIGDVVCLFYETFGNNEYLKCKSIVYTDMAYIPETTTNIECEEIETDDNDKVITKVGRKTLGSPNALNKRRKNLIIGHSHNSYYNEGQTAYRKRTYQLDSTSISSTIESVELKIETSQLNASENLVKFTHTYKNYSNNEGNTEGYFKSSSESSSIVAVLNYTTGILSFDGAGTNVHENCKPVYDGVPNIEITYDSNDMGLYCKKIINSRFSTLFGVNGESNVVFVSGNDDYPHCDWWSKTGDFTYFPTGNECLVGTSSSKIVGYQRLGDDSLAILKTENYTEPTLYIRTGVASSMDDDGNVTQGYFVTAGKYIVTGAISENAFGMLAGDSLFLSRNGVYAISLQSDTISISERVARERSRFINSLLTQYTLEQLSNAKAIVHNNRYYLAIDGDVYVADARFTFTAKGDMADTYNYEWWVWDNCPVHYWFEDEDSNLCFGTEDGRLCKFDASYQDRLIDVATTANISNSKVSFSGITLKSGDKVILKGIGTNVPKRMFIPKSSVYCANNMVRTTDSYGQKLFNGMEIYLYDITGDEGLNNTTIYTIGDLINDESVDSVRTWQFKLYENGVEKQITDGTTFDVYKSIEDEILYVKKNDSNYFLTDDKELMYTFTLQNLNDGDFKLIKYMPTNVVAKWFTPALDMNANDYIKTLCGLTIATEQITNGKIKFGYETKGVNTLTEIDAKGLDIFDFSNLNFDRYTFDTGFTTSFSKKVKDDFNFIIFKLESDNEYDACVYSLTLSYKINRKNKGVF